MGKLTIVGILFLCFLMIFIWNTDRLSEKVNKVTNEMKEMVGNKVIIEKDTLTIVDYSFTNSNYTLSDGRKIGMDYAEKNVIK